MLGSSLPPVVCRRAHVLFTLFVFVPEHLNSPPGFSEVRVSRSLVLYVCFVDLCLSFCTFSFGHCVFRVGVFHSLAFHCKTLNIP
jgi:hypothetical protein